MVVEYTSLLWKHSKSFLFSYKKKTFIFFLLFGIETFYLTFDFIIGKSGQGSFDETKEYTKLYHVIKNVFLKGT